MSFWNHVTRLVGAKRQKQGNLKQRSFRIEALEERQLLAVTAGVFETAAAVLPADAAVWAAPQPVGETDDLGAPVDIKHPDLAPSVCGSPTAVTNSSFTLTGATVKNNGKDVANGYTVTVYASTDSTIDTGDIKLWSGRFDEPLNVGKASTIPDTVVSVSSLEVGQTYHIGWIISDVDREENTGNNTAVYSKTITIPESRHPDLLPSLAGTPTALTGSSFILKGATVKNLGKADANGYTVTVYASTDSTIDTGDIELASYTFNETLAVGAASTIPDAEVSISSLEVGQAYHIGWIISGVDGEENTGNNTAVYRKAVTVPMPRVPDVRVAVCGSPTKLTDSTFTLTGATVKNLGKADANGYTVTVYASTDSTIDTGDIELASYTFNETLAVGEVSTIEDKVISVSGLEVGRSYHIGWIISGVEGETDLSNNTAVYRKAITIPTPEAPDLRVAACGAAAKVMNRDGNFTMTGSMVKNLGKVASGDYTVTVYASTDSTIDTGDIELASFSFKSLEVGQVQEITETISISNLNVGQAYYFGWIISGAEGEKDLSNNTAKFNNCQTNPITIPAFKHADLMPSISGKADYLSNSSFTLRGAMVKNIGKIASSGYTVTVYASTDSTIDTRDIELESFEFEPLNVDTNAEIEDKVISISSLTVGRTYYIGWIISGVEGETNLSNNTARCNNNPIKVPAAPAVTSGVYDDDETFSPVSEGLLPEVFDNVFVDYIPVDIF